MDQEKAGGDLNRRDLLAVGALAAGAMLLADGNQAPGAQVEDRGSAIRITNVRGLPCGTKAYVKIETNHGITGWGEITGLEPQRRRCAGRVAANCSTARTRRASSTSGRSSTARTATCAAGRS